MSGTCRYCDRTCGRCGYPIEGGWEHGERPQPAGSNVVVCTSRSGVRGPLAEVMGEWAGHAEHKDGAEATGAEEGDAMPDRDAQ